MLILPGQEEGMSCPLGQVGTTVIDGIVLSLSPLTRQTQHNKQGATMQCSSV